MFERKFCGICNKDVEIVKVIRHGNYEEQILSCDHIAGRINASPVRTSPLEKVLGTNLGLKTRSGTNYYLMFYAKEI